MPKPAPLTICANTPDRLRAKLSPASLSRFSILPARSFPARARDLPRWLWAHPIWLLWIAPALWAGNLVWARSIVHEFPPVTLALCRWIVAFAALLPFVARRLLRQRQLLCRHGRIVAACGLFGVAGYNALGYAALRSTSATSVAFLNSTLPLLVPLFAWLFGVERLKPAIIAGILVSFVGVAWIAFRGDPASLLALRPDGAAGLILIAVANYAIYSVLQRFAPATIDPLVFLAASMIAGLAVLLPFAAIEWLGGALPRFDASATGAVLYVGLCASLLAYVIWARCVLVLGPTITGASFHLVAVFTALLAWTALGETLTSYHLVGGLLILTGFWLSIRHRRQAPHGRNP